MTATDKTLDLEGNEHLEWHGCDLLVLQVFIELRDLSALNLLPTNDQDPLGASPTMEVQVAGRVMADMFDDGSIFLASLVLLNMVMVQHSGISKHELRLPGVQS